MGALRGGKKSRHFACLDFLPQSLAQRPVAQLLYLLSLPHAEQPERRSLGMWKMGLHALGRIWRLQGSWCTSRCCYQLGLIHRPLTCTIDALTTELNQLALRNRGRLLL